MIGKWEPWYRDAVDPQAYGVSEAYRLGAEWLADCEIVEDWGCGLGWFRQFVKGEYRGIDGTDSPFCDEVVDLTEYRTSVPGIFMRGVLEHNYQWSKVLDNAVASFTERLCIVLFTPMVPVTQVIAEDVGGLGVPDISFCRNDITGRLTRWSTAAIKSDTAYGGETIIYAQR